jgi:inorganic pyrophosphatase
MMTMTREIMIFKAVIEMPMNTRHKYEIKDGILSLDRVLSIPTPVNYGYIDNTLAADGDPIDVFVAAKESIPPGCHVAVRLIGMFYCTDNGIEDNKIVGRLVGTNEGIPLESIRDYLEKYKPGFEVTGYTDEFDKISMELYAGRVK